MCSCVVVVFKVRSEDPFQVSLVEHDDVPKALTPNRPDHPFGVRILPGRTPGTNNFFDTHVRNPCLKHLTVDSIAIAYQESWRLILWKGLNNLLSSPLCRGMLSYIEVNHTPTIVAQHDKREQNPKCRRGHCEEVYAHRVVQVILKKCAPSL